MTLQNDISARRKLTFAQAEGLAPLPRQLKRDELPTKVRSKLWDIVDKLINEKKTYNDGYSLTIDSELLEIFRLYYTEFQNGFGDEFPTHAPDIRNHFRNVFVKGTYIDVFNLLQHILTYQYYMKGLYSHIDLVLKTELCAYRVFDKDIIAPIASEQDVETINIALNRTSEYGALGAKTHLRNATIELNSGNFSNSIRESISAVESISRVLSSEPKAELGKALSALGKSTPIHGGMKSAFNSLYGYTSDENGIRHSLLFGEKANVDETDALFMIGSCSAFVTYLISRAVDANISVSSSE